MSKDEKNLESLFGGFSHHAYFVLGDYGFVENLISFFQENSLVDTKSLDFMNLKFETFLIDDARSLREWLGTMPISSTKKIAILYGDKITEEAQNALLKSFEEVKSGTQVFLVMKSSSRLLPTLMSRMFFVDSGIEDETIKEGQKFLNMSIAKRLDFVAKKIKESKEKDTKEEILDMLSGIEKALSKSDKKEDKENAFFVLKMKDSILDTGAPMKTILESIAITLPEIA